MDGREALIILSDVEKGCGQCAWGADNPIECNNPFCDYKDATILAIEALKEKTEREGKTTNG